MLYLYAKQKVNRVMRIFLKSKSGATLVEYAIIVALISIAALTVISQIGDDVSSKFQKTADSFE